MLLSARPLEEMSGVNDWVPVQTLEWAQGDAQDFYLQLVDASVLRELNPAGRRYCAPAGASLRVTIQDIDSSVTLVKLADRPFSQDQSIWRVRIDALTDAKAVAGLCGTYALKLQLTEPGTTLPTAWEQRTTYATGDLASYAGLPWQSLQDANVGHQPGADGLWWRQLNATRTRVLSGFVNQALSIARASPEF